MAGQLALPRNIIGKHVMTKLELIEVIAREQSHLAHKDVELAVKCMIEQMSQALATGNRIEIRGFGSFSLHYRPPRIGRNPKTGEAVQLTGKHVPHFKPGKELRERVKTRTTSRHRKRHPEASGKTYEKASPRLRGEARRGALYPLPWGRRKCAFSASRETRPQGRLSVSSGRNDSLNSQGGSTVT